MSSDDLVRRVQRAYPMIWFHCHAKHGGRGDAMTERESTVLNHIAGHGDNHEPPTPRELAAHLSIGASTLSEAVDKLVARGFVERLVDPSDRRRVRYSLTAAGSDALDGSSALSSERLSKVLARLGPADRNRAVAGLELIAGACRDAMAKGDGEPS